MKKKVTLIIILAFSSFYTFSQKYNFDIHGTTLQEYLEIEEELESTRIPTTSNHVSFSGNAQPIKYQREQDIIPDLIVYFHFKKKDSAMSYVLYEWDTRHFKPKEKSSEKESKELGDALISKYNELKGFISKDFNKPKVKRNYSNISRIDSINTFVENSTWKPNDSTEIELYATVSNLYRKEGASTINPVHRIRLYVKNQSKTEKKSVPKLDQKRLSELENIKANFFIALESKDLLQSKEYLSHMIKEKVTDEQLNMLIDNIAFERKTELIYSGIQMGFNGNMFTILQYKYSDDKSSTPREMIKLVFDDKDKVVGIQPMKSQTKTTD